MKRPILLAGVASFALLSGCANELRADRPPEVTYEKAAKSEFVAANYQAADMLIGLLRTAPDSRSTVPENGSLIVGTIVNIDSLDHSSTLGRVVSEQISARFSQRGYNMVEMKFRNSVYMKRSEGELVLTREISEVAKSHSAQAVVVGSYGVSGDSVFVNVKVVQPMTNIVMAAYDYVLPLNREIRSMVTTRK